MNNTGYLKSPKFATPKDYPHHSNCTWLVSVNDAYLIVLNVSFLKLHDNDVIEVYDGNNESSTVLARYSPLNTDRKNGSLVSSSSMVYIILKYGKPHNESTRFALNYISQPKPTTTGMLHAIIDLDFIIGQLKIWVACTQNMRLAFPCTTNSFAIFVGAPSFTFQTISHR